MIFYSLVINCNRFGVYNKVEKEETTFPDHFFVYWLRDPDKSFFEEFIDFVFVYFGEDWMRDFIDFLDIFVSVDERSSQRQQYEFWELLFFGFSSVLDPFFDNIQNEQLILL